MVLWRRPFCNRLSSYRFIIPAVTSLKVRGGVAGKIPETVDGAGIQVGCAVAAGASGFFDCALRKGVYGSHNLNFKLDNELDKQAISKKDLR